MYIDFKYYKSIWICIINKTSLTFTPSNYREEQTITITGAHLDTDYSNKNSIITLSSPNVSSKTINDTIYIYSYWL